MSNSKFSWDLLRQKLENYPSIEVDQFIDYCASMRGNPKNQFFAKLSEGRLAYYFKKVKDEGLVFDGKHITLNTHGISYDYVAYKQKMLTIYPNTKMDFQLVYEGEHFSWHKEDGQVFYTHKVDSPFNSDSSDRNIVGGYCIIKNERGEFITTLTVRDFEKHRAVAKTDYIWNKWYSEMCLKTLIKKAVKVHFDDVYEGLNDEDNKSIDLNKKKSFKETSIEKEINRATDFINNAKSLEQLIHVKSSVAELGLSDLYEEKCEELKAVK